MKFSVRQILASAAGAVLAAVIASVFGVKGTIVGVAIGSMAATFGTAVVAQSIDRGHRAVKQVVVRAPEDSVLRRLGSTAVGGETATTVDDASGAPTEAVASASAGRIDETARVETARPTPMPPTAGSPATAPSDRTQQLNAKRTTGPAAPRVGPGLLQRRFTWKAIAAAAGVVFVVALLFITGVELIAGKPLSAIFGGAGSGTSLQHIFSPPAASPTTTTTSTSSTTTTSAPGSTNSTTTSTTSNSSSTTTVPSSTTTTSGGSTTTSTTRPGATTTTTLPGAVTTTSS